MLEETATAKPFEPAIVGMTDEHLARQSLRAQEHAKEVARASITPRTVSPTEPPKAKEKVPLSTSDRVKLGVIASVVVAVVLIGVLRQTQHAVSQQSMLVPTAVTKPAASLAVAAFAPMNVNGVSLPANGKFDPADVLPSAKARVAESGRDTELFSIVLTGAKGGYVDVGEAGASAKYIFMQGAPNQRILPDTIPPADRLEFTLAGDPPPVNRKKADKGDRPVAEPTCVWTAAWQAALSAGLFEDDVVDATYGTNPRTGRPTWVITPRARPGAVKYIDGMSCTIKAR